MSLTDLTAKEIYYILKFIYNGTIDIYAKDCDRFQEIAARLSIAIHSLEDKLTFREPETPLICETTDSDVICLETNDNPEPEPEAVPEQMTSLYVVAQNKRRKIRHIPVLYPDILIKIFAYLPTTNLLTNVALVSKQFHQLTLDSNAHIRVTVRGSLCGQTEDLPIADLADSLKMFNQATDFLARATGMESLRLTNYNFDTISCDRLLLALSTHQHVAAVEMDENLYINGDCLQRLTQTNLFARITTLYIGLTTHSESVGALKSLADLGQLRRFRLKQKSHMKVDKKNNRTEVLLSTETIFRIVKTCPDLSELDTNIFLAVQDLEKIIKDKKDQWRVLMVRFFNRKPGPNQIIHLLTECQNLESVYFIDSSLNTIQPLSTLTKLTKLSLCITDDEMAYDQNAPTYLPKVTNLRIYICRGRGQIISRLPNQFPNLKILKINYNDGDFSLKTFREVLSRFCRLELVEAVISRSQDHDLDILTSDAVARLPRVMSLTFHYFQICWKQKFLLSVKNVVLDGSLINSRIQTTDIKEIEKAKKQFRKLKEVIVMSS